MFGAGFIQVSYSVYAILTCILAQMKSVYFQIFDTHAWTHGGRSAADGLQLPRGPLTQPTSQALGNED